jgi:hypothetical protein
LGGSVTCGQDAPQHVWVIAIGGCSIGGALPSRRYDLTRRHSLI